MMLVEIDKLPKPEEIINVPLDDMPKVYKVCQEMRKICINEGGIGLSATQIGIPWKLFLVRGDGDCPHIPKDEFFFFVDTEYSDAGKDKVTSIEGCLSIRSLEGQSRFFRLERFDTVILTGKLFDMKTLKLEDIKWELPTNQQGAVFQHEIDHHHAVLISDIGKEIFIVP